MNNIPRSEHPKPQFERKSWLNLNGEWDFCFDNGRSGKARKIYTKAAAFSRKITVPFCVESELSGIGKKDFMYGVWYRKEVDLTDKQVKGRTVLHFGAADYKTTVYINGTEAGSHEGGYVSFCFDISDKVHEGKNIIVVNCEDDTRDPFIPRGKQSEEYHSHGCDYTRTTGIWQTVWLEFTEKTYIRNVKYYPDVLTSSITVEADLCGKADLKAETFYGGKATGSEEIKGAAGRAFSLGIRKKQYF